MWMFLHDLCANANRLKIFLVILLRDGVLDVDSIENISLDLNIWSLKKS